VKKILSMAEDYRRLYAPERQQLDVRVEISPVVAPAPAVVPAQVRSKPKAAAKSAPTGSKKPAAKSRKTRKAA
jgi:hypothetical protein